MTALDAPAADVEASAAENRPLFNCGRLQSGLPRGLRRHSATGPKPRDDGDAISESSPFWNAQAAKLATARQLSEVIAAYSLGAVLELGAVDEDELYAALDLFGEAQLKIETALARRYLRDGCFVLYDLTSSYLEGGTVSWVVWL